MEYIDRLYDTACKSNMCHDLAESMYEITADCLGLLTIVSPCWKPYKVFSEDAAEIIPLSEHTAFSSYIIKIRNTEFRFSWIYCSPGASNTIDVCLSLYRSRIKMLVFLGSAGILDKSIEVGEIVVASRSETVCDYDMFFNSSSLSQQAFVEVNADTNWLQSYLCRREAASLPPLKPVAVFSTPSIIGEYQQIDALLARKIQCVEMETYAFIKITKMMRKDSIALLCMSDIVDTTHGLFNRDNVIRERYLYGRQKKLPAILEDIVKAIGER